MTTYEMGDSAAPPSPQPALPVYAFYLGGDTPSPWPDDQIKAIRARWACPIWVNTNPANDGSLDAQQALDRLHAINWPRGTQVWLDTESTVQSAYVAAWGGVIDGGGYLPGEYESKGPSGQNPLLKGGRWIADWTGIPHLYEGSVATQYANAEMAGQPWDCSVILSTVPLAEVNPPVVHPITYQDVTVKLPDLTEGARGAAVARAQGLLLAWNPHCLPVSGQDGLYGPETTSAVRSFQRVYGITDHQGAVYAVTWAALLTA